MCRSVPTPASRDEPPGPLTKQRRGSEPGRPPAASPADRAHVTPASQSPGARRSARRRRGLLGTTNTGGTAGQARAPGRSAPAGYRAVSPTPRVRWAAWWGLAPRRARPKAQTPEHESGLRSGRGASAALERGPAGGPGAEPGRAPDAAAGTAAVGAGRPRKWGCHWASCLRTGGRCDSHRGWRGGGWGPRVAKGRGCCGLAERSAARRGREDGSRRATASQRATARPAALRF